MFENFVDENGEIKDKSWIKWVHPQVPDEDGEKREKVRNRLEEINHCKPCTSLSGCYFIRTKAPHAKNYDGEAGLLHPHCDCEIKRIPKPIDEVEAICRIEKFTGYIFSEKYISNGKMKLFHNLGFDISDSEYLKHEYETQAKEKYLGIPFVITNYFCGNKSVFAALNSHQRTLSTISVVCLAKTVPQDGDFFSAKMRSTEKSAFLDDFSRARGSRTCRTAIERSRKRAKKTPFR